MMGAWSRLVRACRRASLAAVVLAACGGDAVSVDPAISLLKGDWDATKLVVRSVANPQVAPELVSLGAQFALNVQASGQYTAILIYSQQTSTEIGTLSVSGNTVTMHRHFPSAATSTAVFQLSGNRLTLDGDTEFDFNLDGTPEPATAHFELIRN